LFCASAGSALTLRSVDQQVRSVATSPSLLQNHLNHLAKIVELMNQQGPIGAQQRKARRKRTHREAKEEDSRVVVGPYGVQLRGVVDVLVYSRLSSIYCSYTFGGLYNLANPLLPTVVECGDVLGSAGTGDVI
jgi:hypothetical protein